MPRVHIIGAGLAGLSAAVKLTERGVPVTVYESAGQAGGRCRSFYDKHLERDIDNGNHLIMSGNHAALSYLDRIGAVDPLIWPEGGAVYPFVDVPSGKRWRVHINDGPIPTWVLNEKTRVPDTGLGDYLKAAKIAIAGRRQRVSDVVDEASPLYERFWEPLTLAVLNTTPSRGSAQLLWSVIRETFLKGGKASRPLVAKRGLGPAFIDPAIDFLTSRGAVVRFNARLRKLVTEGGEAASLVFSDDAVTLEEGDRVILAIPPTRLKQILPDVDPPTDDASILNVHYRLDREAKITGGGAFVAMTGSLGQWAFVRDDVVSITTSASNALGADDQANDDVVSQIWRETATALDLSGTDYVRVRVIREKRATPDQSPEGAAKRLKPETRFRNLFLAGDHTDTGVPATIEGSIRSGETAAGLALTSLNFS
ncbi:MAG: hydroxysqualene dehydroxylase HpnE [Pseudomonadota bacterium]